MATKSASWFGTIEARHRPNWAEFCVFDSDAAGLYVDAERNIEFLPFELALLTNLAEVLRTLDGRFKAEEAQLAKHQAPLPLGYEKRTKMSAMLAI